MGQLEWFKSNGFIQYICVHLRNFSDVHLS